MSALLDQAVRTVRALPSADQDEIAKAMLALTDGETALEAINPANSTAVLEGLDQAKHRQFAAPEAVERAFARFGA